MSLRYFSSCVCLAELGPDEPLPPARAAVEVPRPRRPALLVPRRVAGDQGRHWVGLADDGAQTVGLVGVGWLFASLECA